MIKICCQSPFEILNNCYKYTYKNSVQKTKPNFDLMIYLESWKHWCCDKILKPETKYELKNFKSILMMKLMINLNLESPSETAQQLECKFYKPGEVLG